jgi:hypothetical protein
MDAVGLNYIDDIAERIYEAAGEAGWLDCDHRDLYAIYAVLALAKGEQTTAKDVHDAWAAWRNRTMPEHRSLIPFDALSPDVQAMDQPYVEAIHAVARGLSS